MEHEIALAATTRIVDLIACGCLRPEEEKELFLETFHCIKQAIAQYEARRQKPKPSLN